MQLFGNWETERAAGGSYTCRVYTPVINHNVQQPGCKGQPSQADFYVPSSNHRDSGWMDIRCEF